MKIAIVGAGMAGLSCADYLVANGHDICLFDKGQGPGGRMSTRRMDTPLGQASFDHGAQYFTVRDAAFQQRVGDWQEQGVAARWPVAGPDAWVGTPGMNAVVRAMASQHDVRFDEMIRSLRQTPAGWLLSGASGEHGPFDAIVIAIPAEQASALLGLVDMGLARIALGTRTLPCWTGMAAFDRALPISDDIVRNSGILSWAARNSAKPGRAGPESWVVQATPHWSASHVEEDAGAVLPQLMAALAALSPEPLPVPLVASAHRWRFAMTSGADHVAIWNAARRIGLCGDWLLGPRVECAWLSGQHLARQMVAEPLSLAS